MHRLVISILIVLAASGVTRGQINLRISDYQTEVKKKFPLLYRGLRPFVGTFSFEREPQPLEPVRVDFTLRVCNDYDILWDADIWEIKVLWDEKAVRLQGDSVFMWPGPHSIGAELSGSFEVVPLLSGLHGFSLYWDEPGLYDSKLDVKWCFDNDGVLTFLDKVEPKGARAPDCTRDWCTFFSKDSVHVIGLVYSCPVPAAAFAYQYTIVPPFRIGDTSTVVYRLTAYHDFPEGLQVEFTSEGMKLISPLRHLEGNIGKGTTTVYIVDVLPLPVREVHDMRLQLDYKGSTPSCTVIPCEAVFNDDGSLRFVSDRWLMDVDSTMLPSAFPSLGEGDSEVIRAEPGNDKVFRHKY